jgi:hypothetical protein
MQIKEIVAIIFSTNKKGYVQKKLYDTLVSLLPRSLWVLVTAV